MTEPPEPPRRGGLLITRGATLRIPAGSLSITIDGSGQAKASLARIEISADTVGMWLRTAVAQLIVAAEAQERHLAKAGAGDPDPYEDIEAECIAGMLAIVSAATAIDAFYAALKERSPRVASIPVSRRGRSSRHRVVFEAIRREFRFGAKTRAEISKGLKEIYFYRDRSVHPSAAFDLPVHHPVLNKLVEWRYAAFRHENALNAVRFALCLIIQLPRFVKHAESDVGKYANFLTESLAPHLDAWERLCGPLRGVQASSDAASMAS